MAHTIGIDFGTAFATAADFNPRTRRPETLARIPAIARMLHGGGALCGEDAHATRAAYALSTVDQVKRFLGRTRAEAERAASRVAWAVEPHPNAPDLFRIDAWTGRFAPEAVAAEILKALKARAERTLGAPITSAVLTIPAAATNRQRLALKESAQRAGLEVKRILHEPTALAMAEAQARPPQHGRGERWAVVNVGAGSTDAAIVDVDRNGVAVRSAAGDTGLGWGTICEALIERLKTRFASRHGVPVDVSRREIRAELLWIGEECARALSAGRTHRTDLRMAASDRAGRGIDLDDTLSTDDLNAAARPAAERLRELCEESLRRADCKPRAIKRVVLAGGGMYAPPFRQAVLKSFGKDDMADMRSAIVPELAAHGAALLGAAMDGRADASMQDILPRGLGIKLVNDRFSILLPAGHPLPANKAGNYTTVENDQSSIHFEVREGDRPRASENTELGAFVLDGIRRARAGEPQIKVTFTIDADGILNVEALDADTGARQRVAIERTAAN